MFIAKETFCLLDYVSKPSELETRNRMFRVQAIYPIKPSEAIVELVYKYPNAGKKPLEVLHKYRYNGFCQDDLYNSHLQLVPANSEEHIAYVGVAEAGVDISLNSFLWLGE